MADTAFAAHQEPEKSSVPNVSLAVANELLSRGPAVHLSPLAEQRDVALFYYGAVKAFVGAGERGKAWEVLKTRLNLTDTPHAATRLIPGLADAEHEVLGLILGDELANQRVNGAVLGQAWHNYGMMAMGRGEVGLAEKSLNSARQCFKQVGDGAMLASAARQLAHLYVYRSCKDGWGAYKPYHGTGYLLQAKHVLEGLASPFRTDGASDFMDFAIPATRGFVLSMLARHSNLEDVRTQGMTLRMDPAEYQQQMFENADAEFQSARLVASRRSEGQQGILPALPGSHEALHELNKLQARRGSLGGLLAITSGCLDDAQPGLLTQEAAVPQNFNAALSLALHGLALIGGGDKAGEEKLAAGVEALKAFGRQDIIDTFELLKRREEMQYLAGS